MKSGAAFSLATRAPQRRGHCRTSDLQGERGSYLARHATDRHTVRTIAGDLEVDDGVTISQPFEAFDREPADGHRRRDVFRTCGNIDEVTKPGEKHFHKGRRRAVIATETARGIECRSRRTT